MVLPLIIWESQTQLGSPKCVLDDPILLDRDSQNIGGTLTASGTPKFYVRMRPWDSQSSIMREWNVWESQNDNIASVERDMRDKESTNC